MATAKICDRCGAVINPPNSGLFIIFGTGGYGVRWYDALGGGVKEKDLCASCAIELKKFLRIRTEG